MADNANITTLSRRSTLRGLLTAPLAGCAAVAVVDPVYALIAAHKAAFTAFCDACGRTDEVAAKQQGREVTQEELAAFEEASAAEIAAIDLLKETPPQTMPGMRAAIAYMVEYDQGCEPIMCGEYLELLLQSPVLNRNVEG